MKQLFKNWKRSGPLVYALDDNKTTTFSSLVQIPHHDEKNAEELAKLIRVAPEAISALLLVVRSINSPEIILILNQHKDNNSVGFLKSLCSDANKLLDNNLSERTIADLMQNIIDAEQAKILAQMNLMTKSLESMAKAH